MTLSEIWIYPVKSLSGIRLTHAEVEEKGLKYDRRWMIIDENGVFVTQRSFHKMALIDVELLSDSLVLSYRPENNNQISVPFQPISANPLTVTIWDDETDALTVSDEADKWLSDVLERNVRLVIMPESAERKADPRYAKNEENVSFADGFPFLIISQASLDQLNSRLAEPIEMKRFRPNFVVTGTTPHEEDGWKSVQIGNIQFDIVKPCARCVLTTVDPETGGKGPEPLKTLATYRRVNNKILFGQNVVARDFGKINEGDRLILL
ncbi:MOSC domain-containing protein [Dyadobacter sp. NIV53]|uniref:MOSC domain-containing protein n=1 Tax=Dyadobacter sp. NIV53 TaxID=2861765 RepID=UPI001C87C392|nr:MOSC domain-containing protein [Dyadobacter sp. NIV53]